MSSITKKLRTCGAAVLLAAIALMSVPAPAYAAAKKPTGTNDLQLCTFSPELGEKLFDRRITDFANPASADAYMRTQLANVSATWWGIYDSFDGEAFCATYTASDYFQRAWDKAFNPNTNKIAAKANEAAGNAAWPTYQRVYDSIKGTAAEQAKARKQADAKIAAEMKKNAKNIHADAERLTHDALDGKVSKTAKAAASKAYEKDYRARYKKAYNSKKVIKQARAEARKFAKRHCTAYAKTKSRNVKSKAYKRAYSKCYKPAYKYMEHSERWADAIIATQDKAKATYNRVLKQVTKTTYAKLRPPVYKKKYASVYAAYKKRASDGVYKDCLDAILFDQRDKAAWDAYGKRYEELFFTYFQKYEKELAA